MKARVIVLLLAICALAVLQGLPAHGQTGIVLVGAGAQRTEGVTLDTGLNPNVAARLILQSAHAMRQIVFAGPPAIDPVAGHVIVDQAHAARQSVLIAPPPLPQVADRIILQFAHTGRQMALFFPGALIGDTVPPLIKDVRGASIAGEVQVTWTTNEFATSEVRYGTASGVYSQTASDPLFVKAHAVTLTGLTSGTVYYCVVQGVDLSGNQSVSTEYQVKETTNTYLPLIRR